MNIPFGLSGDGFVSYMYPAIIMLQMDGPDG